jgi:hypothetical protein
LTAGSGVAHTVGGQLELHALTRMTDLAATVTTPVGDTIVDWHEPVPPLVRHWNSHIRRSG